MSAFRSPAFLSGCVALAISASYELIEWWSALALGQGADDFLGTQGDPWDTQADMFCALIGAVVGLMLFSRLQAADPRAQHAARAAPLVARAPTARAR